MEYKPVEPNYQYPMPTQPSAAPSNPPPYAPNQPQPPPAYNPALGGKAPPYHHPTQPVALTGYQPAYPAVHSQQQNSTNVVVVNQPSATPRIVTAIGPKPPDYLVLSLVVLALCFFHGNWLTFICLIPALVFSLSSQNHANQGNYNGAKSMGRAALGCNIAAFVSYIIIFVVSVIAIGVYYGLIYSGNVYEAEGGCYQEYDQYTGSYLQVCS